eukprot:CAMPEP_0179152620 /NCGR_PEP_ID=MMETSP0796-20121207/74172_1 /TAXON_ID=73915 /ORGANISM="Pyrodinium bahamense, Strain pbaha01" /LENGTH=192 /DNA_ID=CAMNT_0020853833 /DNA_START=6 /DNA_END=585 /DNA_ORIENTATION=-
MPIPTTLGHLQCRHPLAHRPPFSCNQAAVGGASVPALPHPPAGGNAGGRFLIRLPVGATAEAAKLLRIGGGLEDGGARPPARSASPLAATGIVAALASPEVGLDLEHQRDQPRGWAPLCNLAMVLHDVILHGDDLFRLVPARAVILRGRLQPGCDLLPTTLQSSVRSRHFTQGCLQTQSFIKRFGRTQLLNQ